MSFTERNTDLLRIIEIEEQIKEIEHGKEYITIRKNLKLLEDPRRRGITLINAPDSPGMMMKLRRNSSDEVLIIAEYRERIRDDVEKIKSLRMERIRLRRKLLEGRSVHN